MNIAKVNEYINKYGITEAEAKEMLAEDKEIDKMSMSEINADLSAEQKKAIKDVTKTTSGKKTERKPREKKVDDAKVELIDRLRKALNIYTTPTGGIENLTVANEQKEITFIFNGADYSVTLTKHRK